MPSFDSPCRIEKRRKSHCFIHLVVVDNLLNRTASLSVSSALPPYLLSSPSFHPSPILPHAISISPVFPLCPKSTNLFIHSFPRRVQTDRGEVQNTLFLSFARLARCRDGECPLALARGSFFNLHIRYHALSALALSRATCGIFVRITLLPPPSASKTPFCHPLGKE